MTTQSSKRRNYTEDFKRDAVALVKDQGYTVSAAARNLGIGDGLLRMEKEILKTASQCFAKEMK